MLTRLIAGTGLAGAVIGGPPDDSAWRQAERVRMASPASSAPDIVILPAWDDPAPVKPVEWEPDPWVLPGVSTSVVIYVWVDGSGCVEVWVIVVVRRDD